MLTKDKDNKQSEDEYSVITSSYLSDSDKYHSINDELPKDIKKN